MVNVLVLLGGLLIPILVGLPGFGPGGGETTATTTSTAGGGPGGGEPGEPCDPATYDGPYRCVEDPDNDGQYVIAD